MTRFEIERATTMAIRCTYNPSFLVDQTSPACPRIVVCEPGKGMTFAAAKESLEATIRGHIAHWREQLRAAKGLKIEDMDGPVNSALGLVE